jgi:hypothetical protein
MVKHTASLDDKYALDESRQILTGTQAIVRLMLTQRARDVKAGLNTAGYVTGYRGSPIASWRPPCCAPGSSSPTTSSSCGPEWTRPPRRCGRSPAGGEGSDAFGVWYARAPASTAPATCFATPTTRAPQA